MSLILTAVLLGIVQGLTEFLPISSTAHLVFLPYFLGLQDYGHTFDVALHAGTLLALLVYFRGEMVALVTGEGSDLVELAGRARFVALLFISAVPAGLAGVLLEHRIDQMLGTDGKPMAQVALIFLVIGSGMVLLGILLSVADAYGSKERGEEAFGWACLVMGLAQALALIPGVSRSGVTMTAGLFMGLRREVAARATFLISLPIVGGAVTYKLIKMVRHPGEILHGMPAATMSHPYLMAAAIYVSGCLAAAVAGYYAIRFLVRFVEMRNYNLFVAYRVVVGGALIVWSLLHLWR